MSSPRVMRSWHGPRPLRRLGGILRRGRNWRALAKRSEKDLGGSGLVRSAIFLARVANPPGEWPPGEWPPEEEVPPEEEYMVAELMGSWQPRAISIRR